MSSPVRSSSNSKNKPVASPWIRSANSAIHGRGVYARVPIPRDTRVVEYVGDRITKAESIRREKQRLDRQRRGDDGCVYIFELNKKHDLDGRTRGNVARLINHSCAPNCRAETIRGRIWIIAATDIAAGEELTFDYGYGYSEWRLHPCRCGSKNCAGFIVNAAQRWRVRRIARKITARERAVQRRLAKELNGSKSST
jgi:SET domain-containing protein